MNRHAESMRIGHLFCDSLSLAISFALSCYLSISETFLRHIYMYIKEIKAREVSRETGAIFSEADRIRGSKMSDSIFNRNEDGHFHFEWGYG